MPERPTSCDHSADRSHELYDAMEHRLGDNCPHCRAIRRLGPREPNCPLGKMIDSSDAVVATPAEADATKYVQKRLSAHARESIRKYGTEEQREGLAQLEAGDSLRRLARHRASSKRGVAGLLAAIRQAA